MMSYFCHFGDDKVGENFKKVIFGETKLIRLLESGLNENRISPSINKVLIRYFLDGNVSTYDEISNGSFYLNKRAKEFLINYRLDSLKLKDMGFPETFSFIKETTLKSIELIEKEFVDTGDTSEIKKKIEAIFEKIYFDNVEREHPRLS